MRKVVVILIALMLLGMGGIPLQTAHSYDQNNIVAGGDDGAEA